MSGARILRSIVCVLGVLGAALALAACGARAPAGHNRTATGANASATAPIPIHPHAVQPNVGTPSPSFTPSSTSGSSSPASDPNAFAPPLSQVRHELHLELVAATANNANYINPLHYVTCCGHWGRTDQGVDATMPVGAPIFAPSRVKVLDIEPNWYAGQPLVYFELLDGPDAGKVQYVAEEITQIARPGSILQQGQPVARYAASGTAIEYGWSTPSGVTLAVATTGYEEGQQTPAGKSMRAWLNALGANAGPNF